MLSKRKLKLGVSIIFSILKFVCLIPFSLNLKTLKTDYSKASVIWCVLFSITLIGLDPYFDSLSYVDQDVYAINVKPETILMKGTYIMVLICVYWAIFNIKLIFKLINLIKIIFEKLKKFDENLYENDLVLKQFLMIFIITQIALLVILYSYYLLCTNPSWMGLVLYCHITNIKYLFGSSILIKYNIFLIILRIGFSKINKIILKNVTKRALNQTNFEKMNSDCELSDKIDEIAVIYSKLCEASILISKKFCIPILTFLGYIFLVIETQFFKMYQSIAYETEDGFLGLICLFSWCFVRVFELALVIQEGNIVIKKVMSFRNIIAHTTYFKRSHFKTLKMTDVGLFKFFKKKQSKSYEHFRKSPPNILK